MILVLSGNERTESRPLCVTDDHSRQSATVKGKLGDTESALKPCVEVVSTAGRVRYDLLDLTGIGGATGSARRHLVALVAQLTRRYPRDFTFYVADPIGSIARRPHCKHLPEMIPGFETRSSPNLLVATLATLPSISLVP